ncbi:acetyltransferase [Boseaceae bacterium BT-24-1]|nr:acetyltransferase [Boseaceae bacterium BT-24-1]
MLLDRWVRSPLALRWWGEPGLVLAQIATDLQGGPMRQWIAATGGVEFAFVQSFPVHLWPSNHMAHLPRGTEAIDALIGEACMLGRGHGAGLIAAFADLLLDEGVPMVSIDPDASNAAAIRASLSAGFADDRVARTSEGTVRILTKPPVDAPGGYGRGADLAGAHRG